MLKIEYVWRELLYKAIEQKDPYFTLTELSARFNLSTSVVFHAIAPLRDLGIVEVGKINSKVVDSEKLLFFWATRRNIKKDIIYTTYNSLSVFTRESLMPADVFPTAYSAFRLYYGDVPSDYENIYFYAKNLNEVKARFPPQKKVPNIYILSLDPYFKLYERTPLAQIFVDLWNLSEWYAKEFTDSLLLTIKESIGL